MRGRFIHITCAVVATLGLALTAVLFFSQANASAPEHRPIEVHDSGYVSSDACRACHPREYESWHHSYHRSMTRVATPESVLAPFAGTKLEDQRFQFELGRDDDRYFVSIPAPAGVAADANGRVSLPVTVVTGSHHMQVYWYETGYHRLLAQLPFVYLKAERKFIPRRAAFLTPNDGVQSGEAGRWNSTCLNCHSTHGQPRLGPSDEPDTHVAELGIACEACHGPAQEHVSEQRSPLARYVEHFRDAPVASIVQPAKISSRKASEVCSQCHGLWQFTGDDAAQRWRAHGHAYRPGGEHTDQWMFHPSDRTDPAVERITHEMPEYVRGQFWSDGMSRVSGREYNAMIDSPCYQRGELSCLSCHEVHKRADDARDWESWADDQLGVGMRENHACLQCHAKLGKNIEAHTFHAADSSGSLCYNCHMPNTTYGLLKAMRSHQITTPSVATTLATGRPNACNLCHLDRSLGWTAQQLSTRYGIAAPELSADDAELPAAFVLGLRGDAAQRALIAWSLGWQPAQQASGQAWLPLALAPLLDDPYAAVRLIAGRSLATLPAFTDFAYDPIAAPNARAAAADRVRAKLAATAHGADLRTPAVLLDAHGAPDLTLITRLIAGRDDRPITLLE
jgi:hypothetical protein